MRRLGWRRARLVLVLVLLAPFVILTFSIVGACMGAVFFVQDLREAITKGVSSWD